MPLTTFLGALLLAATAEHELENARVVSPNGAFCVVTRHYPRVGDFDRADADEHWRQVEAEAWMNEAMPAEPKPVRGAVYRLWPGNYREPLAEFAFAPGEQHASMLVADDGHFVTYRPVQCGASAELLTIRGADGEIVRTLRVRDVMTPHDQQWLCRGSQTDVRVSLGETLRMTMVVTPGRWDAPDARHHTVDIDLATGAVAAPDTDHCPAALLVVPEADDGLPRSRSDADVVPIGSHALLDRAVVRVLPEYPEVAAKARIKGRVGVQVVIGREGNVESATIVKPLPFGLDEAVRIAIMKWQFAPGESRTSGVLAFRFEILREMRLEIVTCH